MESIKELNRRLWREGRFEEFAARVEQIRVELGCSRKEAKSRALPEFPPLKPDGDKAAKGRRGREGAKGEVRSESSTPSPPLLPPEAEDVFAPDEGKNFLEILEWVIQAIGLSAVGRPPLPSECPGARAWAIFEWAKRYRKDFFSLWAAENRRRAAATAEDEEQRKSSRRTISEIQSMLEDLNNGQ